jgi:hypothetical protein
VIVGRARVIPARCRVDRFLRWRARAIPRVESARPPTSGCSTLTYLRDRITTVIVIFLSSCNGQSSRAPRAPARCATDRSSLRITAMTVAAVQQYNNNNNDNIYIYIYAYELRPHNYRLYTMSAGHLERLGNHYNHRTETDRWTRVHVVVFVRLGKTAIIAMCSRAKTTIIW